ncbi:hypothetical protein NL676_018304 [Syzygium grande]|nr:hypothetical protein NL676_018304 [Syzygium grande]
MDAPSLGVPILMQREALRNYSEPSWLFDGRESIEREREIVEPYCFHRKALLHPHLSARVLHRFLVSESPSADESEGANLLELSWSIVSSSRMIASRKEIVLPT